MSTQDPAAYVPLADRPIAAMPTGRDGGGGGSGGGGGVRLEEFRYNDAIVRKFVFATLLWGVVSMLVGVILALQLALPIVVERMPDELFLKKWLTLTYASEWLNFGRLRPVHTNAAIFAFVGNSMFAGVYYSTQRLCKARMWSDTLGNLHFWGWQLIIVSAALTLPFGITQSKEYAELEWPIDLAIAVVWVGFFGVNFFMTLIKRRERHMYVALWFYIATIVTVAMLHVFNNIWVPVGVYELVTTGSMSGANVLKSYPVYSGVQDAFMQWWYGHNAVAFFLTTPILGLMYYFLPKAADRPVFSYKLSIVHFWSLIFIYIWAGPHHLHYTALPEWASTLGMVFSLMLWMPSWGGMINGLLTLRGAWHKVTKDPVLKFFVAGVTFYGMATFEGPLLSIKLVNSLSHYTDWTIAHVHSGALGWNGFIAFAVLYWMAPRLFQTKGLYSVKLATFHFWIGTVGILLYIISMYWAGVAQGLMWRAFDETGQLKFPDFVETVTRLMPLYWIRVVGGVLFLTGTIIGAYNILMTWRMRPSVYEEPVHRAAPLSRVHADDHDVEFKARLTTNVAAGRAAERVLDAGWHRKWERRPVKFTIWVFVAVATASLFEIIPTVIVPAYSTKWREANIPTIASVQPYTPLEVVGRDIYIAEGCYNCHSQMIRPIYAETVRYGEYSKPGEFIYDHPFQWGSRRIGPDLHREGGRQSHLWHYLHFEDPQQIVQNSVMPKYTHLLRQEIDFGKIRARIGSLALLGVPYGEAVLRADEMAMEQAMRIARELEDQGGPPAEETATKKVIALIAYMQRLGTDLFAEPPGEGGDGE